MMHSNAELVLVIEDSPEIIAFLVNDVLPDCGYRGVSATSGAQALHMISQQHPDVILLDVELPDANGLDLVQQLRLKGNKTPVIVMSAHGSEEIAVRAFRLGVRDYLIKPFTSEQVATAIEDALYLSRLEEEKEQLTQQLQQTISMRTVICYLSNYLPLSSDLRFF